MNGCLTGVTPTLPLDLADAEEIWRRVTRVLPDGYGADVYHDHRHLIVSVRRRGEGTDFLRRTLEAK